jgi:hypothetical protein
MGELHGGAMAVAVVLVGRTTCRRAGNEVAEGNGLNGGRCSAIAAARSQGCPGLLAGKEGEALPRPWGTAPAQLRLRTRRGVRVGGPAGEGRGAVQNGMEALFGAMKERDARKSFALCV